MSLNLSLLQKSQRYAFGRPRLSCSSSGRLQCGSKKIPFILL